MGKVISSHPSGVLLTSLKIIPGEMGNVMHALKNDSEGYSSFGEAYFSTVNTNCTKGWKKHTEMILNIVVPVGKIKFVLFDERKDSSTYNHFFETELSSENYMRLTVPPGIWMAFKGIGEYNLLLNVASIKHDPAEAENLALTDEKFKEYEW